MYDLSKTYCVIGDPVAHSVSPQIHSFIYNQLKLDFSYNKIRVPADELETFVQQVGVENRPGFNVTLPHKESILELLDGVDPTAWRIGAVNTVKNDGQRLLGYNTDAAGCRIALEKGGWSPKGKVVILGAGGAARAAVTALGAMAVDQAVLLNRNSQRAEQIKQDLNGSRFPELTISDMSRKSIGKHLKQCDLLINTTPVGMWPKTDISPVDKNDLNERMTVFDMIPKPVETRLLSEAKAKGCRTIPGLAMLIAQALAAQEIWLEKSLTENLYDDLWNHLRLYQKPKTCHAEE